MKAWAVASAALSLTALCACSSTEDEKAPAVSGANVEDQWKYHVKKSYPQWQAPAEAPAATTPAATVQAPAAVQAAPAAETGAQPQEQLVAPSGKESGVYAEPPGFVVKDNYGTYVAPKPEPLPGDGFSHYTVKKGDSLWTISKMIYHKADKWQKIYDVNKDVIKDPNRLKPGTDLKIPAP